VLVREHLDQQRAGLGVPQTQRQRDPDRVRASLPTPTRSGITPSPPHQHPHQPRPIPRQPLVHRYTGSRDNVAHLLHHPNFEFLRHDVTFPLYVEVDQIYNLACPASPIHYQRDPVQTIKISVHGTINMLGLAKRTKTKILQASTSEGCASRSRAPSTPTAPACSQTDLDDRLPAPPAGRPRQRQLDITRARATLGWTPIVQLSAGLQRTIDCFHADQAARSANELPPAVRPLIRFDRSLRGLAATAAGQRAERLDERASFAHECRH
jgi:hypothetical protein